MSYFVLRVLVESTKRCYRACVGSQYASEKNPAAGSTVDLCQGMDLVCLTRPGRAVTKIDCIVGRKLTRFLTSLLHIFKSQMLRNRIQVGN